MLREKETCRYQAMEKMKGGIGIFYLNHLAEPEEVDGKATLYARGSLPPGASVGWHRHKETMEICYFLDGRGIVRESDREYQVKAGDVSICFAGEAHEIINRGNQNLVYIVLVLKIDSISRESL